MELRNEIKQAAEALDQAIAALHTNREGHIKLKASLELLLAEIPLVAAKVRVELEEEFKKQLAEMMKAGESKPLEAVK